MFELIASVRWEPFIWSLLGIFGAFGLLAVVAPQRFAALTQYSGQWVNTEKVLAVLDKRVDIDHYFLPHSRLFGAMVLTGVFALAVFTWRYFG